MSSDRFLLIKTWTYTLWGDIDHVLGQLLIAEITNRTPVIYWPTHCIYKGSVQTNGFELYFEPVSEYSIFNLVKPEYTYYPPIWDSDNLLVEDQNRETWIYRNIGDIIGSDANVVVGDAYYSVHELVPFIKKDNSAYGMTIEQTYHYLFNKYIKVKPDIEAEIQNYYNSFLKNNGATLAVHVRKVEDEIYDARNDKYYRNEYLYMLSEKYHKKQISKPKKVRTFLRKGKIKKPNGIYHSEIRKYIQKYNVKKVFLLTDSEAVVKEYQEIYGPMLLFTDCKRIKSHNKESYMENPMVKRRRGAEIIMDTYIAAKCDFFIGNDFSRLSHTVARMKDWADKNAILLYWLYRKHKYPINAKLVIKKGGDSIFSRMLSWGRSVIDRYYQKREKGGKKYAK